MSDKTTETKKRKRPQGNSTVAADILKYWEKEFTWGDSTRIHEATGLSRPTIKSAFDGSATDEVIKKITNYYLNKTVNEKVEN